MSSGVSEFELIDRYFRCLGHDRDDVKLGVGDDCAIINVPTGKQLCLSIDTMVEGVHFPRNCQPETIAYRALGAALSDLAAMGAEPSHFSLALSIPSNDEGWLAEFAKGLSSLANKHRLALVGGDTTRGPLTVSIQVHGYVDKGKALTRSSAQAGDILAVTGSLGGAGGGLALLTAESPSSSERRLLECYERPSPRLVEARLLGSVAHACIDISDGLLADAAHIAESSGCKLVIEQESLPISDDLLEVFPDSALRLAISAGDDYELLFSLSAHEWGILKASDDLDIFTKIGYVEEGEGIKLLRNGQEVNFKKKGYQHFD